MIEGKKFESKTRLSIFVIDNQPRPVQFKETLTVKEGVECDIYSFVDDDSKDLAIVTVLDGCKTPMQRILSGSKTIEGFVSGEGMLTVREDNGESKTHVFKEGGNKYEVAVKVGQIMQWEASKGSNLVFSEICYPPYKDGRFENLSE